MSDSDAAFPIHSMEAVKDSSKQRAELPKLVHLALGTNESSSTKITFYVVIKDIFSGNQLCAQPRTTIR